MLRLDDRTLETASMIISVLAITVSIAAICL